MGDVFISEYFDIGDSLDKLGVFDSIINRDSHFFINLLRLKKATTPEFAHSYDRINDFFAEIVIEIVRKLRDIEDKVRNIAAHEVVSVTEKMIKDRTGYTPDQVIGLIKDAFKYTNINVSKEYWNAYDEMNEFIISKI